MEPNIGRSEMTISASRNGASVTAVQRIDLDQPPAPPVRPSWRPWVLVGVLAAALVGGAVVILAGRRHPAVAPSQTTISERTSGVDLQSQVWRDQGGQVIAVMDVVTPRDGQPAWCELSVDGTVVMQRPQTGPAVCVWVRGAVQPLPTG